MTSVWQYTAFAQRGQTNTAVQRAVRREFEVLFPLLMVWADKDGAVCLFRRWSFRQGSCSSGERVQRRTSLTQTHNIKHNRNGKLYREKTDLHKEKLQHKAGLFVHDCNLKCFI